MSGAFSNYGDRRCAYRVLIGKPDGKSHLQDEGIDGRIILKGIFHKWDESKGWIGLAQYMDRWWAIVTAVMNIRVP
jgi:hypothetical protein